MRTNELLRQFDDLTYPISIDRVVTEFGDPQIQHPVGRERLSAVFDRIEVSELESPADSKLVVLSSLSADAVGRRYYSDRDPAHLGDARPDQVTF